MVLAKTSESPLDYKEFNQSILEEISPEYSLEVISEEEITLRPGTRLDHSGAFE